METLSRGILIISVLFLFTGSLTTTDQVRELNERLRDTTKQLSETKAENTLLLQKIDYLTEEIRDEKIAQTPAAYFAEVGYFEKENPYPRDPVHMRKVWNACRKWESLLTKEARESAEQVRIIPRYFVFAWMGKETHYNPLSQGLNKDKDGRVISIDYGITQINSGSEYDPKAKRWNMTMVAWNHGYNQLPAELQARSNPRTDPEVGIAMLYIWMNERVKMKMAWAYLNDWTWYLYWRMKNA